MSETVDAPQKFVFLKKEPGSPTGQFVDGNGLVWKSFDLENSAAIANALRCSYCGQKVLSGYFCPNGVGRTADGRLRACKRCTEVEAEVTQSNVPAGSTAAAASHGDPLAGRRIGGKGRP